MQFGPDARPLTETNTCRPSNDVTIAAAAHWEGLLHELGWGAVGLGFSHLLFA